MVSDAAATKAPVAKLADTISGVFVPAVIGIALVTIAIWLLVGRSFGFALARGISVLVVSCPCALGLATPVAIMVGNGMGAKNGILFKNAEALQEAGNVEIVALDKTGTITEGAPRVTDIIPAEGISENELLLKAASLEMKSEHPLAKAVIAGAEERRIEAEEVSSFSALPGNGLTAVLGGKTLIGGSLSFVGRKTRIPAELKARAEALAEEGRTPLLFTEDGKLLGIIAVADTIKADSAKAIAELKNMGIHVVMLTGDNARTAEAIGRAAGVSEVIAGVLPDGKEAVIRALREKGNGKIPKTLIQRLTGKPARDHYKVAMVGDGINDAPALTRADIGIAIGAGADVAIDAADVVLMKSTLSDVAAAVRLSRRTYVNIVENLFWALIYNTLLIPLAAGAYVHAFGLAMDPMFGAAAMSLSSFCVVSNALRLSLMKVHDASKDKPMRHPVTLHEDGRLLEIKNADEGGKGNEMTKTIKIEGMMCPHCEASVKKALEALPFVAEATASHEAGTAVVVLSGEADEAAMKKAVEDKDYKVLGFE